MQLLAVPVRVLQAFLLKYHTDIQIYQSPGEYINRPSQIYFDGKLTNNDFDMYRRNAAVLRMEKIR
jgi:hypothetical protein